VESNQNSNNRPYLKIALGVVTSIMLTLFGTWLVIGRDAVSRAEAIEITKEYSPYKEDKKLIQNQFANINTQLLKMDKKMDKLLLK